MRHSPLEAFLRSRGLPCAPAGDTRITDDLATATVYLLQRALDDRLGRAAAVGPLVCAVSDGLAALIREPCAWRIAALIAAARVLSPGMGLGAAADLSATAVREYSMSLGGPPSHPSLPRIRAAAARAVRSNDERVVLEALGLMMTHLFGTFPSLPAAPQTAHST